jgi:hypothetical protein
MKSKEQYVCESLDKALNYYFDDKVSLKRTKKLLRKIQGKLVSYVLNKKMTYVEFAKTDDILINIMRKKEKRCKHV